MSPIPERPDEVPDWIDLHNRNEAVVENRLPRHPARQTAHHNSLPSGLLQRFAAAAYGREVMLHAPTRLVVDSHQRLIILDPPISSVHVLDGKQSFRIAGGEGFRMQKPLSVAVDQYDSIYVADGNAGVVHVFDRDGRFTRSLGMTQGGESMFQEPTAVAVDKGTDRIFVLDSPSDEILIFALDGSLLERIGGRRERAGVSLKSTTEIAVQSDVLAVLDSYGSRLQVFDKIVFKRMSTFAVAGVSEARAVGPMGLALDATRNIFLSNGHPDVKIFRLDGTPAGTLDSCGKKSSGIWIDSNQIYVADAYAGRILVYQLRSSNLGDTPARRLPERKNPSSNGSK